jgi:glutamate/tyrosine decarboxylase-like PLP-dependent enzyme
MGGFESWSCCGDWFLSFNCSKEETLAVHEINDSTKALREEIFEYVRVRMDYDPAPLDSSKSEAELLSKAGQTVTEQGLGGHTALKLFEEVLAPATISTDHPGFLSFIPNAATEASSLFDLIVSASSIYGGSWMEGSGAVFAENQVLSWLAKEVGLPESAGGVFVQGGTVGNLSALVAARDAHREMLSKAGVNFAGRLAFIASKEAHSSLKSAAKVMDVDILLAKPEENGKLLAGGVQEVLTASEPHSVFAIVATGGTTNFGIVDDLRGIGEVANANQIWYHVDGAYGLAGILSPKYRHLFDGSELADSFIVDPHKWLFAPFDACALVYKTPALARASHTQHGEYLEILTDSGLWNPTDYSFGLTRRTRGLPLWFSLATHGIQKYREAIEANIDLAHEAAELIRGLDYLELVRDPELSVVVFERKGWESADYDRWSDKLLKDEIGFVVPSSHQGKPNTRFAIVNPLTSIELLSKILESMK